MLGMVASSALRSLLLATAVGAMLRLRRRYNPRVSLAAWTLVLGASLAMPVATQLAFIAFPKGMLQVAILPVALEGLLPTNIDADTTSLEQQLSAALPLPLDWYWLALCLYVLVFGALLLRLFASLARTWRIVRRAVPVGADWTKGFDVRVSRHVDAPATFGSVILVPSSYASWNRRKREAVLAHEGSHVARCDFAIQLAAALNRTVFWFNPFAWWLRLHLSSLAEEASDAAAIAALGDRFGYAEILLELAGRVAALPGAVAMARRPAVTRRIERILVEAPLPADVGRRGRAMLTACIVSAAVVLSVTFVSTTPSNIRTVSVARPVPAAVSLVDDPTPATTARPAPAAVSLAIVLPRATLPSSATPSITPDEPPAQDHTETQASRRMPAAAPSPPARLRSSIHGPSRPRMNAGASANPASQPDIPRAQIASRAAILQDVMSKGFSQESQPTLFERLTNATCRATDIGRSEPAFLSPGKVPAYLLQAGFFRGRDGRPWVTLYYTGGQMAILPVTITGSEITFNRSLDITYTLSSLRDTHLVGFAKRPGGGSVDFACWERNSRPS